MTTHALTQAILMRDQLPLEQLLRIAPQLSAVYPAVEPVRTGIANLGALAPADAQDFWMTFGFGCVQAMILFGLVYAYFAV